MAETAVDTTMMLQALSIVAIASMVLFAIGWSLHVAQRTCDEADTLAHVVARRRRSRRARELSPVARSASRK